MGLSRELSPFHLEAFVFFLLQPENYPHDNLTKELAAIYYPIFISSIEAQFDDDPASQELLRGFFPPGVLNVFERTKVRH